MNTERLIKMIRSLFRAEEEHLKKELRPEQLEALRQDALNQSRQGPDRRSVQFRAIRFNRLSIAAALILLLGITAILVLLILNKTPDYSQLLTEADETKSKETTYLVLSDGSSIDIESEKSTIKYDRAGEKLDIDSRETINLRKTEKTEKEVELNKLIVPYGKQSALTLADGSVVWLNAGSYLIYPREFSARQREVYLSGEAYFEVLENESKPFIVKTEELEIEVLGTSFNISAYPENTAVETVLVRGSVKVSKEKRLNPLKQGHTLKPGEMASYSRESERIDTRNVDVEYYTAWKEGYFLCNQVTLEELSRKLSRYYDVKIVVEEDLRKESFSGKLDNSKALREVIKIIQASTPVIYEEADDKIIIRKEE